MGAASWQDESLIAGEIKQVDGNFPLWWIQQDRSWLKTFFKGKEPSVTMVKVTIDIMKSKGPIGKEFAQRFSEFSAKYDTLKYIIDLYNNTLEKFAHHPLYNFLPQSNQYPSSVVMKNILHSAGVQACANTGEFSVENMALWTRNSILRANIAGNVGALSPERTAFTLSGLPDEAFPAFLGQKTSTNSSDKKGKVSGAAAIGVAPLIVAGIIGLITAAIAAAAQMYTAAQARKAAAFSGVQGWGTAAYAANKLDWDTGAPGAPGMPPPTTDAGTNWPLILGAGAGLLLLTQK